MKAVIWLLNLAIMWCVNYFVLRVAGECFNYTFTIEECSGIYLLLLWVKALIGGSDD